MTTPAPVWSDSRDPEPTPDDDGPWCRPTPGLLPEQRSNTDTVTVNGDLL
ncbi:hypothetical protein [Streptomyces sp. NPDC001492]